MLTATYLHAPKIGITTEQRLWEAGLLHWHDVLGAERVPLSDGQKQLLLPTLEQSVAAWEAQNWAYFARALPPREHWRVAPHLMDKVAFVDIETDGGFDADSVTMIGIYDGFDSQILVKGRDLETFPECIARYELLVTFFGTGFDLPFLRRRFPQCRLDSLHIDLCPALKRLGYSGGLKAIERRLGIQRADEVDGLSGMDAVRLWSAWSRRGNQEALDQLIAYNRADIENLALLLAFAFPRLKAASGFPG